MRGLGRSYTEGDKTEEINRAFDFRQVVSGVNPQTSVFTTQNAHAADHRRLQFVDQNRRT